MLLFLLDIIIISVLILSFASFTFLYMNPSYSINYFKKEIVQQTCKKTESSSSNSSSSDNKEVFNISPNVHAYQDAENVCLEHKSILANEKQLRDAFKKGANWCNYGWLKGQKAMFPIQGSFYEKLQQYSNLKNACGNVGLNGGYFKDTGLKFGVNCYGVKPILDPKVDRKHGEILDLLMTAEDTGSSSVQEEEEEERKHILNFNVDKWSANDPIVVNNKLLNTGSSNSA